MKKRARLTEAIAYFSYRSVTPLPLVVVVGISKRVLLADWWTKLQAAGAAAGAVILMLIVGTILLIRRRANDLLVAERLQQIERTEALGQMTSSVAHDFNNLLTIIAGNLEIGSERLPPGNPAAEKIARALEAARRGTRLVKQMLAFVRHEDLAPANSNLSEIVASMADLLRQAAWPCRLEVACAEKLWSCTVDTGQFERALLNLVVNARDASADGGRIEVSVDNVLQRELNSNLWPDLQPADYVACEVRDHGAGMSPNVVRRAFEPFFTTKPESSGTGLGLSQVFGFVRQSGGAVHIESEVAKGTCVKIMLPRAIDLPVTSISEVGGSDLQPKTNLAAPLPVSSHAP